MKAFLPAPGRSIAYFLQIFVTALLLLATIAGASWVLYVYYQINQEIQTTLVPASELLPTLSNLRTGIYSLHANSEAILNSEIPVYDRLLAERAAVAESLAAVRKTAPATKDYKDTLQTVEDSLQVFDSVINSFRTENPAPGRTNALIFELRRAFQVSEASLDLEYRQLEQEYIADSQAAFALVNNLQAALIIIGVMVIGLGLLLVYTIRRSSRRETLLASGRLQVAAEVGQAAASVLSLEQLFDTTLNLICERFGYYYACIFLIDENGEYAVLRAATGDTGRNLLATGHKALVGSNSTIGYVTFNNRPYLYTENRRRTEYFKTELIAATRSELAVPLRQGGRVIGALDVQSLEADPFTDDDVSIMQTLADQIAVAIGNAAEFTREQERARQLSALSQASVELTGPQVNLATLLQNIARQSRTLLSADEVGIWLPVGGELELKASATQPEQVGRRLLLGEGVSGQAYTAAKPVRIEDYARWEGRARALASQGIQSAMAVPLLWQGAAIGTLTFTRLQLNRPFTSEEERIAQLFVSQAAAAIENTRLLQETQARVNELYTLNQVGQAIAAQTEQRALFDVVRQEVIHAVRSKIFYIALFDAAANSVEIPYSYENGVVNAIPAFPLGQGLTSIVIQTQQPLLLRTQEEAATRGAFVSGTPSQSYLGIPILQRDQVLGVMAVQDNEHQNAYTEADARLLLTIAAQVGLAIQNVRLLEQTRLRAEELAAINRVAAAASSVADLPTLLEGSAREIVNIFKARNSGITLLDPSRTQLEVIADYSLGENQPKATGIILPLAGNPSSVQVIESHKGLIVYDAQHNPLTESVHDIMRLRHTECLMIVPMVVRGEVIGTIGVDTDRPERAFTPAELSLAETLAAQVATAVDNNHLFQQVRRRAEQLSAAAEVARAAISTLEPDELIVRAAELIRRRFDLYYVAVFTLDERREWAVLRYATGEAGQALLLRKHRLQIGGQSMVGTAVTTRKARIALDVGQEAVRFNNPLLPDTHSEMALPLIVGDNVFGALDVQSTQFNAFSEEDITVLQTMADQIAVAIQNAQLYLQTERRVQLEQLINRVIGKLRRAIDADSIMKATLTELQDVLRARRIVAQIGPAAVLRASQKAESPSGSADQALASPGGNGHEARDNGH